MTGAPPRPLPPPRYEARNTDGSAGSRHLSRLDAVLPAVVTIRLRGGGLRNCKRAQDEPARDTKSGHTTSPEPRLGVAGTARGRSQPNRRAVTNRARPVRSAWSSTPVSTRRARTKAGTAEPCVSSCSIASPPPGRSSRAPAAIEHDDTHGSAVPALEIGRAHV